ncbi:MAG TPA: guanylate kinase [Actinomycetota bacterium]|nr:guanylate kinase [Actinomycetota bacterium]
MEPLGRVFVIAGPSGVGKGTIVRGVLERVPRLRRSISATTRPPRPNERHGAEYVFVSDEEFSRMARDGDLLEWAEVFGHRYGTPVRSVREALERGEDVLLEIDVQGAHQVRERMPSAVLILLEPPSMAELERRLRERATEDEIGLSERLATAEWELDQRAWFDHVVLNDDVEEAVDLLVAIIQGFPTPTEGPTRP